MVGKSYNNYYKLLGIITWTGTDIPEKNKVYPLHFARRVIAFKTIWKLIGKRHDPRAIGWVEKNA
jgi:hypothetical protein